MQHDWIIFCIESEFYFKVKYCDNERTT